MLARACILMAAGVWMMAISPSLKADAMNDWTINMQDKADNYARWLDHPPKRRNVYNDALMMRKFIYTCTMLKAYSGNDWCGSSRLTQKWLGYANLHGFEEEIRAYKQTTSGHFRFPKKILEEINQSLKKAKK